jgi:hypothetical protein
LNGASKKGRAANVGHPGTMQFAVKISAYVLHPLSPTRLLAEFLLSVTYSRPESLILHLSPLRSHCTRRDPNFHLSSQCPLSRLSKACDCLQILLGYLHALTILHVLVSFPRLCGVSNHTTAHLQTVNPTQIHSSSQITTYLVTSAHSVYSP